MLLLYANFVSAQIDQLVFKKLTVEEGLSQNTVSCLFQDYFGFLWIGTDNGLNRFDGYDVKIYRRIEEDDFSLSGNWVTYIYEDDYKNLWVLTYDGLNKYDRVKEKFIRYTFNPKDTTSAPSNKFHRAFADKNNNLWFSTSNGLCVYNETKDNFKRIFFDSAAVKNENNHFNHITEDKGGNLWITSYNRCTKINIKDFSFKHYSLLPNQNLSLYSIICDSDNDIWITTNKDRLIKFNREKDVFEEFVLPIKRGLTVDNYSNIVEDDNKRLWFGATFGIIRFDKKTKQVKIFDEKETPKFVNSLLFKNGKLYIATNYGLYLFDTESDKLTRYLKNESDPYSLNDNQIYGFSTDNSNSIWIRTVRGGVNKIIEPFFKLIRGHNSLLNSKIVYDITEDNFGNIWFGTLQDGINKLNIKSGEIENFSHNDKNPFSIQSGFLNTVFQDRTGVYWIGSRDKGVTNLDPATKRFIPIKNPTKSLVDHATRSFYEDSYGTIWIGTRGGGLNRYDRATEKFTEYVFQNRSNLLNQIITIHEDRDKNFWFGTDTGLVKFNRRDGSYSLQRFENKKYQIHSANSIFDIYEDKHGFLWLTTYGGGLIKYNKKDKSYRIFTETDGLLNNYVYNILEDDAGYLWLNTYRGLSRFDPITNEFMNFTKEDGLPSNELKADGAAKLRNGNLVFGSANGAFYFDPLQVNNQKISVSAGITSFKSLSRSGEKIGDIYSGKEIILPYDSYLQSIEFSAFEFDEPHNINYAYKLEGFDQEWHYSGKRRLAIFTNLSPGDYEFKVTTYNKNKVLRSDFASIKFSIQPPFWKLWWVKILAIIFISLSIFGIIWLKINSVRRLEEAKALEKIKALENDKLIKEELARDLHDEINSELISVIQNCSLLNEEAVIDSNIQARVKTITTISERLRNVIRDVVWFIKPENDDNEKLISRFYSTASEILAAYDYEIDIDKDFLLQLNLSLNFKKQLYLIYKEALQNASKYSFATLINISIQKFDNGLMMEVSDNGVGFDLNKVKEGNGLINFYERANIINSELFITSSVGEGTSIVLITGDLMHGEGSKRGSQFVQTEK